MSEIDGYGSLSRREICPAAPVRRVAAMLDQDPEAIGAGDLLPTGWQFILLGADTRRSQLREDGFPGLGVPMPDLGLPRLMLGGRSVQFRERIRIGDDVRRTSAISSLTRKEAASGPMAVITVAHQLHVGEASEPAIVEEQTFLLLGAGKPFRESDAEPQEIVAAHRKTVVPDETLLFQYSALGFNSHKIHIDRSFAREVEGFPDLVVNGGLVTLLLTEFARNDLALDLASIRVKHLAPLFCGRPITLAADRDAGQWRLTTYDERGRAAATMEVTLA